MYVPNSIELCLAAYHCTERTSCVFKPNLKNDVVILEMIKTKHCCMEPITPCQVTTLRQ